MHYACNNCGEYRGRAVLDVVAKAEKKAAKQKARQREMGATAKAEANEEKPLSTEELSKK
jgi:ribosomal protein L32